jgi:tetratricopeptide (TPR) repeat protein
MQSFSARTVFLAMLFLALGSVRAQDNVKLGKEALQQKSYDVAIDYFQKAQKAAPRTVEANYFLGEAYRLKGVQDSAEMFLQRAVDINDEYIPAMTSLGTVFVKIGQGEKAGKIYAAATKADKKNPGISLAFGNAYLEVDSLDKAVVFFSRAKDINENLPEVYVGLAEAYGRQNIAVLAISNYQRAAELEPKSAVIRYKLGKAFYKNRQYNDCAREFQEAVNLDPTNDVYVLEVAQIFYRAKMYRESARFFGKYVTLKKDNRVAYGEYAKALYAGKFYKDAVPVIEEAIKLNPKLYDLKPALAHSLYESGESQRAIDSYKALPKDSLIAEDYVRIGRSYMKVKDPDYAIASFEKAITMDTASTETAGDLAGLYMGKKMYDKAAAQYDKKLKAEPKNIGALVNGGVCFMVVGKYDTAKAMMQKVIELRPDFFQAYLYLAKCYYLLDSLDHAKKQYQLVLSIIDTINVPTSEGKSKEEKYGAQQLEGNKFIGLIELLSKNYPPAIEYLKKAMTHESKEKKDVEAHLWLAQSYALSLGNKKITVEEAQAIRQKAIDEYKTVLKLDPKNAAATKELKQLEGG